MQRTTAVYLGDDTAIARTVYGDKIYVDTKDVTIAPHLLLDGQWEQWISDAIIPMVRGCTFFDVGANFGWYSLLAARFGAAKVSAFEPNGHIHRLLYKTLQVNGLKRSVDAYGFALCEHPLEENLELTTSRVYGGSGGLLSADIAEAETKTVNARNLDSMPCAQIEKQQVVLKIDVEGYEPRVVLGARNLLLGNNCTAFVEYHADPKGETKLSEMLEFFSVAGYSMSHVTETNGLRAIDLEQLAGIREADMLCFRKFQR